MPYAVSVTMLQAFHRYLLDETGRITQESVVRGILEKSEPTPQMEWGSTFHAILEDPSAHVLDVDSSDITVRYYGNEQMCLTAETLGQCLSVLPEGGLREVPASKVYVTDNADVVLVTMRADHIVGGCIYEHKSRWNRTDLEYDVECKRAEYEQHMQARFYADAFGCDTIRYTLFWLSNGGPVTTLEHVETITIDASAGVADECQAHVEHFMEFADNNGLLPFLADRYHPTQTQPF